MRLVTFVFVLSVTLAAQQPNDARAGGAGQQPAAPGGRGGPGAASAPACNRVGLSGEDAQLTMHVSRTAQDVIPCIRRLLASHGAEFVDRA